MSVEIMSYYVRCACRQLWTLWLHAGHRHGLGGMEMVSQFLEFDYNFRWSEWPKTEKSENSKCSLVSNVTNWVSPHQWTYFVRWCYTVRVEGRPCCCIPRLGTSVINGRIEEWKEKQRDVECARQSSLSHRCVMHRQCPVSSNHYSYPSFYIREYPGLITSSRRVCYPFRFHLSTNQMMMRSRARTHTPALLWTHTEHGWSIFYKFIAVKRRLSSEPKTKKNNEKAMRVSPVQ